MQCPTSTRKTWPEKFNARSECDLFSKSSSILGIAVILWKYVLKRIFAHESQWYLQCPTITRYLTQTEKLFNTRSEQDLFSKFRVSQSYYENMSWRGYLHINHSYICRWTPRTTSVEKIRPYGEILNWMQCILTQFMLFCCNICCFFAKSVWSQFQKTNKLPNQYQGACAIFDFPNVSMLHIGWMNWNSNIAWYIYLPGYIGWLHYIGRMNWKAIR